MTLGQSLFGLLRMLTYGLENIIAIPIQEFQILSYWVPDTTVLCDQVQGYQY